MLLRTRAGRTTVTSVVGALALTTSLALTTAPAQAAPAKPVRTVGIFPSDALTVADPGQITGRRVALSQPQCLPVTCGLLNQLDGFDLDPRIAVRFSGPVDASTAGKIVVEELGGSFRTAVDRVVLDPATNTIYAHPAQQLAPSTTYRIRVRGGLGVRASRSTFTTLSATDGLLDLRGQIESGSAFTAAGITDRGLRVDGVFPSEGTQVVLKQDVGTAADTSVTVPPLYAAGGATFVFGSYLAPSWLRPDVSIAQTPTRDAGPAPTGQVRVPFVAVVPAGAAPAGGWPVAIYGHGFTRSTYDVFLAAATNVRSGLATVATNVVGHGFGPASTWEITRGGVTTTLPSYGRGVDQNGDGVIGSTEGSSATGASVALGSRDTLRQTATDVMTLVRSVGGTDVDRNGSADLRGADVTYFGQSFGGIYGTLLAGADPTVARSVLNVPGGPISEIVRLSPSFRPLTTQALAALGLLNSTDPTRNLFQEQLPLRGEGAVTATVPGALAIQDYLAQVTWVTRPGSPETFAPLVPDEQVLVQVAFGDRTVPNPTSYTLIDAGDLFGRTSLYRNDRTANAANNPHGFLLQLPLPAALQGQAQVAAFLRTGATIDPDGAGAVWEVPVVDPATLLPLNFANPALRP